MLLKFVLVPCSAIRSEHVAVNTTVHRHWMHWTVNGGKIKVRLMIRYLGCWLNMMGRNSSTGSILESGSALMSFLAPFSLSK